ncbi:MAG: tyrosine-type recombinase/integrase [archaeon]
MLVDTIKKRTVKRGNSDYIDIHGTNQRYNLILENLKKGNYKELSKENSKIILTFLEEMRKGKHIPLKSKKGNRSFSRLNRLFDSLKRIIEWNNGKYLFKITEKELETIFDKLNNDEYRRNDGKPYKDKREFKKNIATFWHWYQVKTYREKGIKINDITEYITTDRVSRPKWCYFTLDEFKNIIMPLSKSEDVRTIIFILFDSGLRPSELFNLRKKDIVKSEDGKYLLSVSDEISKTFGRRIKLFLSNTYLDRFLKRHSFKEEDLVFTKFYNSVTQFWVRNANKNKEVLDIIKRESVDSITNYDLRHNSACFYINLYKDHKHLMNRFAWKKYEEIEYYTRYKGLQDPITEEDLLDPQDKLQIQEENQKLRRSLEQSEEKTKEMLQGFLSILEDTFAKNNKEITKETIQENEELIKKIITLKKQIRI